MEFQLVVKFTLNQFKKRRQQQWEYDRKYNILTLKYYLQHDRTRQNQFSKIIIRNNNRYTKNKITICIVYYMKRENCFKYKRNHKDSSLSFLLPSAKVIKLHCVVLFFSFSINPGFYKEHNRICTQ